MIFFQKSYRAIKYLALCSSGLHIYFCKICKTLHPPHSYRLNVRSLNPFHPSVVFQIETSHLICTANQMTGFYII